MSAISSNLRPRPTRLIIVGAGLSNAELQSIRSELDVQRILVLDSIFDALFETSSPQGRTHASTIFMKRPVGTGSDQAVTEAFRRLNPDIRLVLMLERNEADQIGAAMSRGFDDAFTLPVSGDRLKLAIDPDHALKTERVEPSEPATPSNPDPDEIAGPSAPHDAGELSRSIVEIVLESAWSKIDREIELSDSDMPPPAGECYPEGTHRDILLLRAVMEGHDIRNMLVESMRTRTGIETMRILMDAEDQDTEGPSDSTSICIRIGQEHERLGHLHAEHGDAEVMNSCANWLRHWMLLNELHADLRRQAWTDELTGAGNRRSLSRVLGQVIERARSERRPVTVMYFDIDNFKTYNDRFGHAAGDAVLRETVLLLRSVIRRGDHVFRIGGDEFVVIFAPDPAGPRSACSSPPESIEQIASRFQRQIGNLQLPMIGAEGPENVSISAGMVTYPWDGSTPEELLRKADQLALESKRSGKNVITFGPDQGNRDLEDFPD